MWHGVPRELAKVWHASLRVKLVRDWSSGGWVWMLFMSLGGQTRSYKLMFLDKNQPLS